MDTTKLQWKVFKLNDAELTIWGEKIEFKFPTDFAVMALSKNSDPLLVADVIEFADANHIVELHNRSL